MKPRALGEDAAGVRPCVGCDNVQGWMLALRALVAAVFLTLRAKKHVGRSDAVGAQPNGMHKWVRHLGFAGGRAALWRPHQIGVGVGDAQLDDVGAKPVTSGVPRVVAPPPPPRGAPPPPRGAPPPPRASAAGSARTRLPCVRLPDVLLEGLDVVCHVAPPGGQIRPRRLAHHHLELQHCLSAIQQAEG